MLNEQPMSLEKFSSDTDLRFSTPSPKPSPKHSPEQSLKRSREIPKIVITPTITENFRSPRDYINSKNIKIQDKKFLSKWLNGKVLYVNSENPHRIKYKIFLSNSLHDKYDCYVMSQAHRNIVRNIEEDDYVISYHNVILFTLTHKEVEKIIGYILISMDENNLYLYDIFMKDKYKLCPESFSSNSIKTNKTLYNRFLSEFDKFCKFSNVKIISNPILTFPQIKKLIS